MFDPVALLFDTPELENRFRLTVQATAEEIGGWLLVHHATPFHWHGHFSWKTVKKVLGPDVRSCFVNGFVNGFVILPNHADQKETEYRAWDFDKAQAAARATADAYGSSLLHFHTHPNNSAQPSAADLGFAGQHCELYRGYAEFCVVTPKPLRLWHYGLEFGHAAQPDKGGLTKGVYWSWRNRALRQLLPWVADAPASQPR